MKARISLAAIALLLMPLLATGAAAAQKELIHHEIKLDLSGGIGALVMSDVITLQRSGTAVIRLAPWMKLTALRQDGKDAPRPGSDNEIRLKLPRPGPHKIEVTATGSLPKLEKPDRSFPSGPFAHEAGLYLPHWSGWFPEVKGGKARFRLTVVTKPEFRAVATGTLERETLGGKANTAIFASNGFHEAPSVFAGPYRVMERETGGVRLRTYFHPRQAKLAGTYLDAAARYIAHYAKQIGDYPFKDFHIVSAPVPAGLGFPNLTYIGRRILPLPFMRGRSLAHEVAHNWWGNGVAVDYGSGNWSEGLTTYMADHALAEARDPKQAREMRLGWLRDYAALPKEDETPVTRFVSKTHDASQIIGYGKVAFIFHMLRQELGEDVYDSAIAEFWRRYRFKRAGWAEIAEIFESVSGKDLTWFFEQWTRRKGAPLVKLDGIRKTRVGSQFVLEVRLSQSKPYFWLSVPVEVVTNRGVHKTRIALNSKEASARIKLDTEPFGLLVDPHHDVFRQLLQGEAPPILRDVLLDKSAKIVTLYEERADLEAAFSLARAMFRGNRETFKLSKDTSSLPAGAPLLVLGSARKVESFMKRFGIAPAPFDKSDKGSARAWVVQHKDRPVVFVAAGTADALKTLKRPLPHYRSRSYVVFEGRKAVKRGVWKTKDNPMKAGIK